MKKLFSFIVLFFVLTTYGAVTVNVNGSNYSIPQTNERGWGTAVTSWIQAISSNTLQPVGGSFTLTNDVDFGANYGLKAPYFLSRNLNPSTSGLFRLSLTDYIGWRNNANSGNLLLGVNASDQLTFNGSALLTSGNIVNADVSASAAIDASKIANGQVSNAEFQSLDGVAAPIVTTTGTQSLTNKDINGGTASNTSRITLPQNTLTNLTALTRRQGTLVFDTTSNKPYFDDGANLRAIGSGSGGSTNLIDDGDAEAGISNYITGSYSAATRPAGTFTVSSGTGLFAISTSTSSPIFGNTSFLLTKSSGASRQGRAIERTIDIPLGYRTKILKTRIDYTIVSGSFVAGSNTTDSSLIWYVGQFNGSTWYYTEPSIFKMFSSSTTNPDYVEGEFQVNSDTTQIKLIAYVAETANSAWVVKCEVGIKESVSTSGATNSTLQNYTPSNTQGFGTVTAVDLKWGQRGETLALNGGFTSGTVTGSTAQLSLPNGLVVGGTTGKRYHVGELIRAGGSRVTVFAVQGNNYLTFGGGTSSQGDVVGSSLVGSSEVLLISASDIPIQGWAATTQQSDGYDGRLVAASYTGTSGTITAGGTRFIVDASTRVYDETAAVTTGASWKFTAPSSGTYRVSYIAGHASVTLTTGASLEAELYKNGSFFAAIGRFIQQAATAGSPIVTGQLTLKLNAGDYIDIREAVGGSVAATINSSRIDIEKLSASTTISATELTQFYTYTGSPTGTLSGSYNTVTYGTSGTYYDTHGAYSGGVYTLRKSGCFDIKGSVQITHTTAAGFLDVGISFNGAAPFVADYKYVNGNGDTTQSVSGTMCGKSGDNFRIQAKTNLTTPVYSSGAAYNYFILSERK